MDEIHPFRIHSFEDEAREVIDAAHARAGEILREAEEEGRRILERARREGVERGLEEGRAQGAREERERFAREAEGVRGLLETVAGALRDDRAALKAAAGRDLLRLAVAVAERILRAEVRLRPDEAVRGAVLRAAELAADRRELRVRLHPQDVTAVETLLPELRRRFSETAKVTLEADESVSRGGCVVRTREGAVDAQLETRLREIERGLAG